MKFKPLLIVLFSFFSQFLCSQSQEPVKLFLNSATANIGDTVSINLTVQNFKDFKSGRVRVSYNSEELRYQSFTNKAFANMGLYEDGNAIRLELPAIANTYSLNDNAVLITLKMYVYNTARDGTNNIALSIDDLTDNLQQNQLNKITMIGFSGSINTNQKPLGKLQVESKIQSLSCNSTFRIQAQNVGGTINTTYDWIGGTNDNYFFGRHRKDFQDRVSLKITDDVQNKLFVNYFIGTNLFDGEIPLTAKVEIALENCETPTATITATGGKPPYLYQFDALEPSSTNVFRDFAIGTHNIYVTDALGCSAGESPFINIQQLAINYKYQYNNCISNSGILTINTEGGTPIFKIYVDGVLKGTDATLTLSDIVAGKHILKIVDSKGCEKQIEANLESSPLFTVYASAYGGNCVARNIKIDIFNTTQPFETYLYQLDNGVFSRFLIMKTFQLVHIQLR